MNDRQIIVGDCLEVMRGLADASVDAVVTDPPYGLSFMGKRWDYDVPAVEVWAECLRVLKPGGHLLAFAGTRTQHRMAVRIEDAGFEIRDMIAWVYGSGFPKSHNLHGEWEGWGTALKPAMEPITVARKPLDGTVAKNVLAYGTGAINVDGCRIGVDPSPTFPTRRNARIFQTGSGGQDVFPPTKGRWPANLIHDGSEEVVSAFPKAGGAIAPVTGDEPTGHGFSGNVYGSPGQQGRKPIDRRDGGGSAARFFYCAKASRADRNEGCEAFNEKPLLWSSGTHNPGSFQSDGTHKAARNYHPTVKPTALMRYLCRLVTPPGGLVLDPFAGSGSTGKAAALEGFRFLGIERDPEYAAIAKRRIDHVSPGSPGQSPTPPNRPQEPLEASGGYHHPIRDFRGQDALCTSLHGASISTPRENQTPVLP